MHTKHPDTKLSKIFAKNIQPNSLCSARGSEQKLIQEEYSEQSSVRERNEKNKLHRPPGQQSSLSSTSKKQEKPLVSLSDIKHSEEVSIDTEKDKIKVKSFEKQNQGKSAREQYPNKFSEFEQIGAEISPIKAMLIASQLYESIEIKPQNLSKSFNIELNRIENEFKNYDKQESNIRTEGSSRPRLKNSKISGSGIFYESENKKEEEPQLFLQQQSTGNTAKKIKRLKKSLVFIIEKNAHIEYMEQKDNDAIEEPKLQAELRLNQQNEGSEINNDQASRPDTQRFSTSKFSSIPLLDFQKSDQKVPQIVADSERFHQELISNDEYQEQLRFIHLEKQKFRRYCVLFQEFSQYMNLKKTYFLYLDFFRFVIYVALISTFYNYAKEVLCIILGVNVLFGGFVIALQPFKKTKYLIMNILLEILFDLSLLILLVYGFIEEKIATLEQKLTMGWVIIGIDLLFMIVLLVFCLKQLIGGFLNQYGEQQMMEEETLRPDLLIQVNSREHNNNGNESADKKGNQQNTLN